MNGIRSERVTALIILETVTESLKTTLYSVIGGLTGLGISPSSHIMVAILEVTDSDLTFIGGLGSTTVCKTQ